MEGLESRDLAALLRDKIVPLPADSRALDLDSVFGDRRTREPFVDAMIYVLEQLGINYLVGFNTHMGPVISAGNALNIDYDIAYKIHPESENGGVSEVRVRVEHERLKSSLVALGCQPHIAFMDNVLDTGTVGGHAVDRIGDVCKEAYPQVDPADSMGCALFLTAVTTGGGQEFLRKKKNVLPIVFTLYEPRRGFIPNPALDETLELIKSKSGASPSSAFVGTDSQSHNFRSVRPTLNTRIHKDRPGRLPRM